MKGKIYNLDSVVPWAIRQGFPVSYVMEQEEIPFADPRLFGKEGYVGAQSPPHITLSTTPYIAELDDVIIYNKSNLIIKGNTALDDVAAHPTYGKYVDLMHDKTVLDQKDKQVHLYHDTYDLYDFKSCGIFLSGLASGYFGHWGPEFLAKLQVLEHHKDYKDLPIIVDRDMPQSHFDYLSCITQNDLVKLPPHTGLLCTKLLVAPTNVFFPSFLVNENKVPHQDMALSPRTLLFLRERVLSKIQGHSRFG